MDMIERVARAIRRQKFERTGRLKIFDATNITQEELAEARAAIEAMREPTEEMISAACMTGEIDRPTHAYVAMIDAALSQSKEKE